MTIKEIKQHITILNVLSYYNKDTDINKGNFLYSPFRSENTPSFHLSVGFDKWFDFGIGEGGDVFDLVRMLENTNDTKKIYKKLLEIYNYFKNNNVNLNISKNIKQQDTHESVVGHSNYDDSRIRFLLHSNKKDLENNVKINIKELENYNLINYLKERKIDLKYAKKYLREIWENNKFYYVGFQNDLKGYELRNKYIKKSIYKKYYTTIINNQQQKEINIFEGFMDFLSYLTLKNTDTENYLILNSVINYSKLDKDFLNQFKKINLFLDNDETGDKYTNLFLKDYKNVKDYRYTYKNYKDLNYYLINN